MEVVDVAVDDVVVLAGADVDVVGGNVGDGPGIVVGVGGGGGVGGFGGTVVVVVVGGGGDSTVKGVDGVWFGHPAPLPSHETPVS